VNEKELNHPAHLMDRTANWCSHGGLVHSGLTEGDLHLLNIM
jgi:hypothetical protein